MNEHERAAAKMERDRLAIVGRALLSAATAALDAAAIERLDREAHTLPNGTALSAVEAFDSAAFAVEILLELGHFDAVRRDELRRALERGES